MTSKRVIIVGGVAGGASCAARLRRLDEQAEILLVERGEHISFANCGLPYHVGGVIPERKSLLLVPPAQMEARAGVRVLTRHEVTAIHRETREVTLRDLASGIERREAYTHLVLSPGAAPIRPPLPGLDHPAVKTLRSIEDMDAIITRLAGARQALVVGGGYIGLEMAEALRERRIATTLVELADQVLGPLDPEMAALLHRELRLHGVDLRLKTGLQAVEDRNGRALVRLSAGEAVEADLVVLAIGVKPETTLAVQAGLTIGTRGGIAVDAQMRTSDPAIFAVGDAVEVTDLVSGQPALIPLAGPANRQGRIAADVICGRTAAYEATQGTAICKVFNLAAACTGLNAKTAARLGRTIEVVYLHPANHARYYPGASILTFKVLYDPADGRVLGGQAVGAQGADKTIDALAMAVRARLTVDDLAEAELCYAPPYGSAKDPLNFAGMIAGNIRDRSVSVCPPGTRPDADELVLDVGNPAEFEADHLDGAINIPIDQVRKRLGELPAGRRLFVYCPAGLRGYLACRILQQRGYACRNLNGGLRMHRLATDPLGRAPTAPTAIPAAAPLAPPTGPEVVLDTCGLQCPGPVMALRQAYDALPAGGVLKVLSGDSGFASDLPAWATAAGAELLGIASEGGRYVGRLRKSGSSCLLSTKPPETSPNGMTGVVFSGDFDKVMAAFIIANGAAAMGQPATLFFTFWGICALRRKPSQPLAKTVIEHLFGWMLPGEAEKLPLSKMHMGGAGRAMIKGIMRRKNAASLSQLIVSAQKAGVRLVVCTMSMDLMGIKAEELIEGVEFGGVAAYLGAAQQGRVNLFI